MSTSYAGRTSQEPALYMRDASLDFGGGAGVFDLNLSLPQGAILGMIGPSGCGKTTTIRLLNGIYAPTGGDVEVFGKQPTKFSNQEKERLGYIPQQFILYPNLSAEENLHFLGGIYGMSRSERNTKISQMLEFVELDKARKRLGNQMSGGMQRRLMLAGALLHDPDLLFADEPTAGIDPILRARIWENFRNLRDQGKTLLVTTQYVGEAAYCDQVAVLREGRLVTVDTPDGLRRRAMGGEVLHIQIDSSQVMEAQRHLDGLPQVKHTERTPDHPERIQVFVESAGRELPLLLAALSQQGITPSLAEPYLPPFDEVFVRLIQRVEAAQS